MECNAGKDFKAHGDIGSGFVGKTNTEIPLIQDEPILGVTSHSGEQNGKVRCRDRLGVMLKYYYREAA